jgi:hypothetical protein
MIRKGTLGICGIAALAISAAALVLLLPERCGAIPAFTRASGMSCAACHAPVPLLTEVGKEFADNGYRLGRAPSPEGIVDTGDSLLALERNLPLAVRIDAYAAYFQSKDADRTDLETPYMVKALAVGMLSRKISFYLSFVASDRGDVMGVMDAAVKFSDLFGLPLEFSLGQFQIVETPFDRMQRITYEDYAIYTTRIGMSPTDLTYDRGVELSLAPWRGSELSVEVVNGDGIGPAGDYFDDDNWKNVLFRASQEAGPVGIGAFGYLCRNSMWRGPEWVENRHYYWGLDAAAAIGEDLRIAAQFLQRVDENPFLRLSNVYETSTNGVLAEAVWAVRGEEGRSFVTLLYNFVGSNVDEKYANGFNLWFNQPSPLEYESATVNFSYLLRRNLRITTEATYRPSDERSTFVAGMVTAF